MVSGDGLAPDPSPQGRAESAKPSRGGDGQSGNPPPSGAIAAATSVFGGGSAALIAESIVAKRGRPRSDLSTAIPRALRRRMTRHEVKLWNWIRESVVPLGYHFRRQVPIERFVVDFACLKQHLIVEIDGEQHGRDPAVRAADRERDALLARQGYRVLRITNQDVDRRKTVVLDTILAAVEGRLPPLGPAPPAAEWPGRRETPGRVEHSALNPTRLGLRPSPPSPAGEGSLRSASGAD